MWWKILFGLRIVDCDNPTATSVLASCPTLRGSAKIANDAAQEVFLNNTEEIGGDLIVREDAQLTALTSESLQKINGDFKIEGAQGLTNLRFSDLAEVGRMVWNGVPDLKQYDFDKGLDVSVVDIQNTKIEQLIGLNINLAGKVYMTNNPHLINMSLMATGIYQSLTVDGNISIVLPNLLSVGDITFRGSILAEMLKLSDTHSLRIYDSLIETCGMTVQNLGSLDELTISNNKGLRHFQLDDLFVIADIQVENNDALEVMAFESLRVVFGFVNVTSNISTYVLTSLYLRIHLCANVSEAFE